jgi:hypothetical protein
MGDRRSGTGAAGCRAVSAVMAPVPPAMSAALPAIDFAVLTALRHGPDHGVCDVLLPLDNHGFPPEYLLIAIVCMAFFANDYVKSRWRFAPFTVL